MKKVFVFVFFLFTIVVLTSCAGGNVSPYSSFEYGKYPKTIVDDKEIKEKLDEIDDSKANELGYLELDGKEYKRVIAKPYNNYEIHFSNNAVVRDGRTYYFSVEPVLWRVLKTEDGNKYLISQYVIDGFDFVDRTAIEGKSLEECDISYENSNIRNSINNIFYNRLTNNETNKPIAKKINIKSGDTEKEIEDKVWLPSYELLMNKDYRFLTEDDRYTQLTDYAKAIGCANYSDSAASYYYDAASYMTLTPSSYTKNAYAYVDFYGKLSIVNDVNQYKVCGIRPCICIKSVD